MGKTTTRAKNGKSGGVRARCLEDRARIASGGMTMAEIGYYLGISRERVRQIRDNAMRKLRAGLKKIKKLEIFLWSISTHNLLIFCIFAIFLGGKAKKY